MPSRNVDFFHVLLFRTIPPASATSTLSYDPSLQHSHSSMAESIKNLQINDQQGWSKTRKPNADYVKFPSINSFGNTLTTPSNVPKERRHSSNSSYSKSKRSRSLRKRTRTRGSEGSDPRSPSSSPSRQASSTPTSASWSNELNHSLRGGIVFNEY